MRVRGTIQFSRRDAERVWFMARGAGGAVAGPPGVVVRHGRPDVGASTGSNRDAGSEVTIDSCITAALARVNRCETNSRVK